MSSVPVLIVGAGPTGLVFALWLARLGVRVRLIDKTAEPGTTSRALGVQARTLEFYHRFCQGSRQRLWPRLWPTRARLGIGPPLTKGADADAVLGMRVGSCDGAAGAHRPRLSPLP